MKKSSQNNRSALLTAGENSLSHLYHDNQNLLYKNYPNKKQSNLNNNPNNPYLSESTVRQVYKRQTEKDKINNKFNPNIHEQKQRTHNSKFNIQDLTKQRQISSLELQTKQYNNNSPSKSQSYHFNRYPSPFTQAQLKKLMMKLTLFRLRKMQALVRGFLVRRKIYPKLLQEYLIAKSVLQLVQANVIYKEISSIIMQTITFPKYQKQENIRELYQGHQKQIQQAIYDLIVTKIIRKQMQPVIQDAIISKGLLVSRPQITFGFNLRDPLQLLMYQKLMQFMSFELKLTCEQSIRQEAEEKRELFIVSSWIEKYNMLHKLYEEIANQLLQQNIGEYIVEDIMNNMTKQAVFVIANTEYNNQVNDWYKKVIQQMKQEVEELILQGAIGQAMLEMGYGMQKIQYRPNQIIQKVPIEDVDKSKNANKYNGVNQNLTKNSGRSNPK